MRSGGTRIGLSRRPVPRQRLSLPSPLPSGPGSGGRSSLRRLGGAAVPYLLVLPVVVAIGAILGYPLYRLVTLSFQRYGLPELIQRKGEWIGLDNYRSVLGDAVFWDTLVRTVVFTAANVALTMVLGLADRAPARPPLARRCGSC